MKKIFPAIAAGILLSLAACTNNDANNATYPSPSTNAPTDNGGSATGTGSATDTATSPGTGGTSNTGSQQ
jgi:hypothetical protein